ncbi:hypothetical protein BDV95DRAFT_574231 [Massariosphaeria phaeospora]|uniref:Uncharacterized protein n=1 Tax=Massariosphaeria phaeospora TaxID=100035 RepID=A0A7C8ICH1_9PLEO|nr:hypothetical protein BDV95DRAFT_574231 [Massariosphaeria phaeospora]
MHGLLHTVAGNNSRITFPNLPGRSRASKHFATSNTDPAPPALSRPAVHASSPPRLGSPTP